MKTFRTVAILLSLALFSKGYSQDNDVLVPFPNGVQVFFFETSAAIVKQGVLSNAETMDDLTALFNTPGFYDQLAAIEITSASSPSGSMTLNERLSGERAQALQDYLLQTYPQINPAIITQTKLVVDTAEFRSIVETELDFPGYASVMRLLNNNYDEKTLVKRLALLPPNVKEYLRNNIYPKVQYGRVRILTKKRE